MPSIWRIIMAVKRALPPTHPGEILGEAVLPALKLCVVDAPAKLGVTPDAPSHHCSAKPPSSNAGNGGAAWQALRQWPAAVAQSADGLRSLASREARRHARHSDFAG